MEKLQEILEAEADYSAHPLTKSVMPVLVSKAGVSPRGYPFLVQEAYQHLRNCVPHILGMGLRTLQCIEHLSELVKQNEGELSEGELENFSRTTEVIRAVVRTAAITAPPDLWLLHHVLSGLKHMELLKELTSGQPLRLSEIEAKGLVSKELVLDLNFLVSRGLIWRRDGFFHLSSESGISELFEGIPEAMPGSHARLSELWSEAFSRPAQFQQWDILKRVTDPVRHRESITQTTWAPTLEEVELGYRLVPLVLGLHASGVSSLVLQSGIYFITDSSDVPMEVFHGAARILEAAGVIVPQKKSLHWDLTWLGKRVLQRGIGPFGIVEAYHQYMINLPEIWRAGKQRVAVSRGTNIAASQLANARSFEKANDAIDRFCKNTGHEIKVFIEHALGRGEATRQRFVRLKEVGRVDDCSFVGADLEDPAIDAAVEEQRVGKLPSWMKFVRHADIGQPQILLNALREWDIPSDGAFMVVGNGFHEVREQTDESIAGVFKGYHDAGIIIVFTEESALMDEDLIETAWNTYHAGFRYVHERSGQVLRPAENFPEIQSEGFLRSSWAHCAEQAGYLRLREYCSRSRTIFPYRPKNGRNPAISVNHFLVPRSVAKDLGIS